MMMIRARRMFLCAVLIVPLVLSAGASSDEERSYKRTDPVTGQILVCRRCPPGSRLRAHCTSSSPTQCVPCGAGLYTEFWNFIPNCLLCDACADLQRVVRSCNATTNTLCECEPGFFWEQHFCRKHATCKPGHGVKTQGSPHRDTVCELCPDGQFADITQTCAPCVTHSVCATHEQLLIPGSKWHDNVCATCDHITTRGWLDLFRPIVSGLFVQQRMPIQRLQRFMGQRLRSQTDRRAVDERIQQWISGASDEELLKLPNMLEKSRLNLLADKIRQKLNRFQMFATRCTNNLIKH
ncbi:tumor necrosis factor receptor superfamily member 11B-like [Triplophysa dalaica]|uniref:tumor necrosis factor receptor superfamily member 11B-like n=1 Tax=Triplophysa dalaica TaxID=1582913 RepID=UPI0024DF3B3C|nr:tumor necrosis factor receptor superfamily member 11B-like [Triplophysa dalaica]